MTTYRQERVERLLKELRYEITRGMMDGELPEEFCFEFVVPISKTLFNGVVMCRFATRPMLAINVPPDQMRGRFQVIDGGKGAPP